MHVKAYMCMCVFTRAHTHAHTHARAHTHAHTRVYTNLRPCLGCRCPASTALPLRPQPATTSRWAWAAGSIVPPLRGAPCAASSTGATGCSYYPATPITRTKDEHGRPLEASNETNQETLWKFKLFTSSYIPSMERIWHLYLTFISDIYLWHSYQTFMFDIYIWHLYLTITFDIYIWHLSLTLKSDISIWHLYLTFISDNYIWHFMWEKNMWFAYVNWESAQTLCFTVANFCLV